VHVLTVMQISPREQKIFLDVLLGQPLILAWQWHLEVSGSSSNTYSNTCGEEQTISA
jgi:hypothetical protein